MSSYEQFSAGRVTRMFENLPPDKWNLKVDELCADFPKGSLEGLLPTYFLRSTYPKIGGQIVHYSEDKSRFWGLLLPRNNQDGYNWTLRSYWVEVDRGFQEKVKNGLTTFLYNLDIDSPFWYETAAKQSEKFIGKVIGNFGSHKICSPSTDQAVMAVNLQRQIWNVEDPNYLYPFDLYRPDSGLATRLVATHGNKVVGFLFGFNARGNQWLGSVVQPCDWVESQLMGVEPQYRRMGIAKQLKIVQREQALDCGIQLIHWTVDPLQSGNAFLNLNELGGVAAQFYPDYYPFQNELNRVGASRIAISWFVNSQRVQSRIDGQKGNLDFSQIKSNSGTEILRPMGNLDNGVERENLSDWMPTGEILLIQIPSDWSTLQRENLELARNWRQATDLIWSKILGIDDSSYALTGIVKNHKDDKIFLVAERSPTRLI